MNDLFNQWGNFLFHTRNVLFPVFILVLLFIWPPVALTNAASCFVMTAGLLMVALGQLFRITTIGLDYIVRGWSLHPAATEGYTRRAVNRNW